MGTVVTAALLFLVLTGAVSVVTTSVCTRRCYWERTSSPGPTTEEDPACAPMPLHSVQPSNRSPDEPECDYV